MTLGFDLTRIRAEEALRRDDPATNPPRKVEYRRELVRMLKEGLLEDVDPVVMTETSS